MSYAMKAFIWLRYQEDKRNGRPIGLMQWIMPPDPPSVWLKKRGRKS